MTSASVAGVEREHDLGPHLRNRCEKRALHRGRGSEPGRPAIEDGLRCPGGDVGQVPLDDGRAEHRCSALHLSHANSGEIRRATASARAVAGLAARHDEERAPRAALAADVSEQRRCDALVVRVRADPEHRTTCERSGQRAQRRRRRRRAAKEQHGSAREATQHRGEHSAHAALLERMRLCSIARGPVSARDAAAMRPAGYETAVNRCADSTCEIQG